MDSDFVVPTREKLSEGRSLCIGKRLAGWLADQIEVIFEIFKIHYRSK